MLTLSGFTRACFPQFVGRAQLHHEETMNTLSTQIGFWASLLATLTCILFTACFVAIAKSGPLFRWTNLANFLTFHSARNPLFGQVAQGSMLIFGVLYVVILNTLYDYTADEKKVLIRLAIALGVAYAALIGIHYFVQITTVRFNIQRDTTDGLEHFLQAKPDSAIAAINMLGWTIFFGLSSLCVAPIFVGGSLEIALRWLFALNGIFCLLAGVGFVIDNTLLIFFTINLGMGGCITTISILLCILFANI